MELDIISTDDATLNIDPGQITLSLPKSPTLLKEVKLSNPISVYQYKGSSMYVGLGNNTIAKIDSNYQIHESFITCSGLVESIVVYKDRIYILLWIPSSYLHVVYVYDMSGRYTTQWVNVKHSVYCKKMIRVADQVLVADRTMARITVYFSLLIGQYLRD